MFVTEGRGGERLALRPDFTIPVCLHHLGTGAPSGRYAYEGLVFRRHDTDAPERLETGFENIGGGAPEEADAEAVALAVSAAGHAAAGPLRVRLGDIGVFVALLDALGLPEPWRRRLRRSFGLPGVMDANLARLSAPRRDEDVRLDPPLRAAAERHDRAALVEILEERLLSQGFSEGAGRTPAEIADRFLDQRALAEARIEPGALEALRRFLALDAELAAAADSLGRFAGNTASISRRRSPGSRNALEPLAIWSPPPRSAFRAGSAAPSTTTRD
jgi:ATP phosphoribosyltransferase regulatory subunit